MDKEDKAKISELFWWAVKWAIVAVIVVGSIQIYQRLDRHNLLVDAVLNSFRQVEIARQKQELMREKALQELPKKGDPVPTEDPIR